MLLEFASKRKAKKKNCKKGYPCGYSCINQKRNCRAKLKGQGKTYADWLKKNSSITSKLGNLGKTNTLEQAKAQKIAHQKINKKAKPRQSTDHIKRRKVLDNSSNNKALEIITNNMANGLLESDLRTNVAELIDRSKKQKIADADIVDRIRSTLDKSGLATAEPVKLSYGTLSLKDTTTKPKRGNRVYWVKSPADRVQDRSAKLNEQFTLKKINSKNKTVELIDRENKPVTAPISEVYPQRYRSNPSYLKILDDLYDEIAKNQRSLSFKEPTIRKGSLTSSPVKLVPPFNGRFQKTVEARR